MLSQTTMFGRMVKCYNLPMDEIKELNNKYEENKNKLNSMGSRLAGRLQSELEFTELLQTTNIFKNITQCMSDYIETCQQVGLFNQNFYNIPKDSKHKNLEILSCWINDMKEGEYNPPHTHHDQTGWSTVLFLKVPEFINDAPETAQQKYKDGKLGFIGHDGITCQYMEPEVGHFYIFEARHQHCVMPFKTKIKNDFRRSMSFNFIAN